MASSSSGATSACGQSRGTAPLRRLDGGAPCPPHREQRGEVRDHEHAEHGQLAPPEHALPEREQVGEPRRVAGHEVAVRHLAVEHGRRLGEEEVAQIRAHVTQADGDHVEEHDPGGHEPGADQEPGPPVERGAKRGPERQEQGERAEQHGQVGQQPEQGTIEERLGTHG